MELFKCGYCEHFRPLGRSGVGSCTEAKGALHGGGHVTWATSKACGGFALRPEDDREGVRGCAEGSFSSTAAQLRVCSKR